MAAPKTFAVRVIHIALRLRFPRRWSDHQWFACRKIRGSTTTWSQHAWGNALDAFASHDALPKPARWLVRHFRLLRVHRVIYHDREWDRLERRWEHYGGVFHGNHIHVEGSPSRGGTPPCAR